MILIIDDEPRWMREYINELVESGYVCHQISHVDHINSYLSESENLNKIDLIILDIMMPPGDTYSDSKTEQGTKTGEFVLKELHKVLPNIPIMILTNKTIDDSMDKIRPLYVEYNYKEDIAPGDLVGLVEKYLK